MTEAEWLECTDPDRMLPFLSGAISARRPRILSWLGVPRDRTDEPTPKKASARKLRLLACACCFRIWPVMYDARSQRAVELAERYADGMVSDEELRNVQDSAWEALERWQGFPAGSDLGSAFGLSQPMRAAVTFAARAAFEAAGPVPEAAVTAAVRAAREVAAEEDPTWAAGALGAKARVGLMCDLFGNPFRPVILDPTWLAWNGGTVPKLAQAIYDECRFADLPILADALEEAGCDNIDVLAHCRSSDEHVRGCWVVDLLLGKE
jgi:hypothetical protein